MNDTEKCLSCKKDYSESGERAHIVKYDVCSGCSAELGGKLTDDRSLVQKFEDGDLKISCSEQVKKKFEKRKYEHYRRDVSDLDTIDIYDVCDLFIEDDNSGCIHHAVKKLLMSGRRGSKDNVKDLQEAIDTIQRKIEILQNKETNA